MAQRKLTWLLLTAVCVIFTNLPAVAARNLTAQKWQRLELTFKSSVNYTNPLQEAEMRVIFVSPLGETNRVYGFWDGGKTWRVRFQPGFAGRWTFHTMCSDTANKGLNGVSGEFLCTATKGESSFDLHGPIHVARTQKHLEHADRTSFLWLGDAAWHSAIRSTPTDWQDYVKIRAEQKFNVLQWRLNTSPADPQQSPFAGREILSVSPETFRQLDAKIIAANRAGLLCAIAPLWEINEKVGSQLPEDQAIRLMRYAVARWGADHVAWIVAFESDSSGVDANRWQNIGRAVFGQVSHAPVILLPGESVWAFDAFRHERWIDILGIQTASVVNDDAMPWLLYGPLAQERQKSPAKPIITIAPPPEVTSHGGSAPINSDLARRVLWTTLLINSPAGVSYQSPDVSDWLKPVKDSGAWRESLSTPGAQAIAPLSQALSSREFWRFSPIKTSAPSANPTVQPLIAVSTEHNEHGLIYSADGSTLNLPLPSNNERLEAKWWNPRDGSTQPAVTRSPGASLQQFTPPSPGDWVLAVQKVTRPPIMADAKKPALKIDKRN